MASRTNRSGKARRFSSSKSRGRIAAAGAVAIAMAALSDGRASAVNDTWVGNDSNNWSDGFNWPATNTAPASLDSLFFGVAGTSGTSLNDDLGTAFALTSLNVLPGGSAYTISTNNGSSINLGTAGGGFFITNNSTNTETISNVNLALQATSGTSTIDAAYGNIVINSVISGASGIALSGSGNLTLTAANTFTGTTTVGALPTSPGVTGAETVWGSGTMDLNFAAAGAPTSNILYNGVTAGALDLGGGTLEVDGAANTANSQTFSTMQVAAGFSTIKLNPGSNGTVAVTTTTFVTNSGDPNNRAQQLNIIIPAGATFNTTQANSASSQVTGVLSFGNVLADVTVNSTDWAVNSGGVVAAYSSYTPDTSTTVGTASQHTNVVTDSTFTANQETNTIRFNTPDGAGLTNTINLGGKNLYLNGGGLLMTPNVGANNVTITGGAGTGVLEGANNRGPVIFQYDTLGMLVIDVPVAQMGTSTNVFTMGGGGTVSETANAVNTYNDCTMINSGTLIVVQNSNLGLQSAGASVNLNGSTLEANATFGLYNGSAGTNNRSIGIGSDGGTIDVTSGNTLTVSGVITSQNAAGAGNLTKTDSGTLLLNGADTYAGHTTAQGGVLELGGATALPGGTGGGGTSPLVFNGGVVGLTSSTSSFTRSVGLNNNQVQWTGSGGFAAFGTDSTINLGGAAATLQWNGGSFVPTGSSLVLGASSTTNMVNFQNPIDFNGAVRTVQVNRGSAPIDATLSGVLSDSTNTTGGMNVTGNGILDVTAANTYGGATTINGGTLLLGSGGSLGNTAVAVNSTGILTTSGTTSHIGGTVTVNSGGSLDLRNGVAGDSLTLGGLSLAGGGSLGFDLGGALNDSLGISSFGDVGTTALNFSRVGGLTASTYTLISGGTGISTSDFTFNPNAFAGYSLSLTAPGGTSLVLNATLVSPPLAYWKGTVDSVWSDTSGSTTNWVDGSGNPVGLPGGATQVVFTASSPNANFANTTIGSVTTVDSIVLANATSLNIGGAGSLTLNAASNGNGIVANSGAGADTISVAGIVLGAPQTWENNSSSLLTVSSMVSGTSGNALTINSSGTGAILLAGTNTYSGGTIITSGTLQAGSTTALGSGKVTINSGALDLNGQALDPGGLAGSGGTVSDSSSSAASITLNTSGATTYAGSIVNDNGSVAVTVAGSGTEVLTGASNTYSGGSTINSGATLQIGDGATNAGSLAGNTSDGGVLAFNTPAAATLSYAGSVSGAGSIIMSGAGVALLSGNNTEALGASITAGGTLRLGSATALNAIPVNIAANSTLDLNSNSVTVSTLNDIASATTDSVTNSNAAATSTLTVGSGGVYSGTINDGAGHAALSVTGGTLTLAGMVSTYTGGTNVTVGTLQIGNGVNPVGSSPFTDNAMGIGPTTITNGTLLLNTQAGGSVFDTFNFGNNITLAGTAALLNTEGIDDLNGTLTISGTGNSMQVEYSNKPLVVNGSLTGTGALTVEGYTNNTFPAKDVQFYGDGTNYTGNVTLNAVAGQILIGNTNALVNANLSINGNYVAPAGSNAVDILFPQVVGSSLIFGNNISSATIGSINSVNSGDGNIILTTDDGESSAIALTIGNNNQNSNISGIISDTSQSVTNYGGSITKIGTGTLTLGGANTYSGGTTISAGTFIAANTSGSATGSADVSLNGATFASGATGSISGNLLVGGGTNTIAPGGIGTIGSLTLGGLSTTNTTTLAFDLGTGTATIANGDLLTLGSETINIANGTLLNFAGTYASGTNDYRLIGGSIGGINVSNLVLPALPAGVTSWSLSDNGVDPGFIDLVVTVVAAGPANLTWNNAQGNYLWDTASSSNWNNGSSNTVFHAQDNVTFNDSNPSNTAANYAVTLNTLVSPGSVTVNNTLGNYSISGNGTIGGTGSLTKSGTGTLTLSTPNTYSGGTIVTAGKLLIGQAGTNAIFTGPTLTTANTLTALPTGTLSISGNGIVRLADGVTNQTFVTPNPGVGALHPTSNINLTSLSLTGDGTLDIGNNRIIIDYTAGNDPIASIKQWIANGFTDGEAVGAQPAIISSDIAADDLSSGLSYGIGYADGADGAIAGLPSGEIEIMFTLVGDANLDGTVNSEDFTPFSNNLNDSGRSWDQGDFNYDGTVNSEDFTPFSHNLNQSAALAASETGILLSPLQGVSNGISLTNVPEPASTGLLTICAVGVLGRRLRRKTARA